MSKSILKNMIIVIIIVIFIYAFSASYTANSIDNISYVTAIAVDLSKDKQNIDVSFEFVDTSAFTQDSSSEAAPPIIDTVTSTSINTAVNLLNSYVGKEINLAHCKVIIFSDELASRGLNSEITELMNNIQIRPTTNILISKCSALEYIQKSNSSLEKVLTKYFDIFPHSSEYTGYISNIFIGKFYNNLINKPAGNLAILGGLNASAKSDSSSSSDDSSSSGGSSSGGGSNSGGSDSSSGSNSSGSGSSGGESSSSEQSGIESIPDTNNVSPNSIVAGNAPIFGVRGTENIGLAVFKEDKYIGDLTAMDTLCHTIITGEVDGFLLTINNPELYENYIDINLIENTSPEIKVDISKDIPTIDIDIKLTGRIVGIKKDISYSDISNIDLDKVSNAVNDYLKNCMTDYLNKTSKEFQCDIDEFYNFAKHNFLTIQDWENYDWRAKYPNANFNVSIDANISYSLLNSD